jgi:hypothetical protein
MKKSKSYSKMTVAELEKASSEFETTPYQPQFAKPPANLKRRHDRLLRKIRHQRGRPVVGAGAQRIQVTMERGLLQQVDAFARSHHLTRSQLLAQCVASILSGAA